MTQLSVKTTQDVNSYVHTSGFIKYIFIISLLVSFFTIVYVGIFIVAVILEYIFGFKTVHVTVDTSSGVIPCAIIGCASLFVFLQTKPVLPSAPKTQHQRKSDTIHGDARLADDWEIDEALRNKAGGFDPAFKD